MSRCAYHISGVHDLGGTRVKVTYTVTEGEVASGDEEYSLANGTQTVSVTRYRATSVLEAKNTRNLSRSSHISELNRYLADTYVTGSRTAIDEQAI
jgi:hypothetical protein